MYCNMQIVVVTNVNNTLTTLAMRKHYVRPKGHQQGQPEETLGLSSPLLV